MRRLEVTLADEFSAGEIWNVIKSATFNHISDIYIYGDHLEILAQDAKAAESELRDLLSSTTIRIQSVDDTAPNMENVFVMRLRELGQKESHPVPFPHMRTAESADKSSQRTDIAIQARNLTKNFKDFRAVDNVELEIGYGDIYG